ncbi:hypothetical protein SOM11_07745 [Frigoribacterium sp. CFBP9039]|uniref:hypothetical protein n=2 Tax=Frigoribacterium TaxID=96492 RepID=UPI002A6B40E0|nr:MULTISPECIES: hypothetical protein [unclassified Frigoribacterium]MDY0891526.1 hypothetical protein [Frigoribacterium sp. CFBP9030]MDY0945873.1 hypothetical protein [Frigoribacterium sp. CFBP9039]
MIGLITISALVVTAGAAQADDSGSVRDVRSILNQVARATVEEDRHVLAETTTEASATTEMSMLLELDDVTVAVPRAGNESIRIESDVATVGIGRPFESDSSSAFMVQDGVTASENFNGTRTTTAVKEDGTLQIATILDGPEAPERFDYDLELPEGTVVREDGGLIFLETRLGVLIGGFTPAWALDAAGTEVPTRYELDGHTLTQVVDHKDADGVIYPITADPAYSHGMISQVKHERWRNGGYEIRFTVTALARATQLVNPGFVYSAGLADLRQHHPNSMQYRTMAQQWDCHVVGLLAVVNVDLESRRRSWDGWRRGIPASVIKKNPAAACNW